MEQSKVLKLVAKICNMESTGCRSLNKSESARELLNMANVPSVADIQEIPLDCNNQVVVLFLIPNDSNYYSLFAGIGTDKKFHFELAIAGKLNGTQFDFYDDDKVIDIDYFKNYEIKEKNLTQEWEELNKKYVMSETMSSTSDIKTSCFNVYEVVDKGQYNYDYIKQPFYYKVTFIRNENRVFCIPVEIEKKEF